MNKEQVTSMFVFAILAVAIGFSIPFAYHTLNSDDYYFELIDFSAENISYGSDQQTVLFDRYVPYPMDGGFINELNLIRAEGDVNVYGFSGETFFEYRELEESKYVVFNIPDDLEPGDYYWDVHIELHVYKSVYKEYNVQSNIFKVKEALN